MTTTEVVTEVRTHAAALFPGAFLSESGRSIRVEGDPMEVARALLRESPDAFCVEISEGEWRRWDSGDESEWRLSGRAKTRRVYVGQVLTVEDLEQFPDDHRILVSNMRGNRWDRVVHTRAGNFQPVEDDDVVLPDA